MIGIFIEIRIVLHIFSKYRMFFVRKTAWLILYHLRDKATLSLLQVQKEAHTGSVWSCPRGISLQLRTYFTIISDELRYTYLSFLLLKFC